MISWSLSTVSGAKTAPCLLVYPSRDMLYHDDLAAGFQCIGHQALDEPLFSCFAHVNSFRVRYSIQGRGSG